ncbi:MAG: hypothetical protein A4E20_10945 [Nitrospira sp. SG-bin2]|uniref:glutaredoxin family protein n=1 Tax=Nitrospira cf. moscoviensis SBR1015 TaxID=96242 RepID=UPI000A0A3C9C|nr:glutaredoxin family protein [Nitrospira cf. moscoviensis SBR1015]OQW34529.1 MAG: hypothetical protein A4E20_10945 [Nitrospira sp. SG-bin2]
MTVKLFSTPNCFRCNAVKKRLNLKEIPYEEFDLTNDIETAKKFRAEGLNYIPVLEAVIDGEVKRVDGYRPDFIDALAS